MKKTLNIVLDTSIFVNPDSRYVFGNSPIEAFNNFLDKVTGKKHISCYMPPTVYEELLNFLEYSPSPEKNILITKKPPSSYQSSIPSIFLYEFIEEMRSRINKGLRIAEKYTRKGLKESVYSREKEEATIQKLRQEYRPALREGILDSKEDFDLVLISKEINAYLATSDNGLIKWAHKLGITCINSEELKEVIS